MRGRDSCLEQAERLADWFQSTLTKSTKHCQLFWWSTLQEKQEKFHPILGDAGELRSVQCPSRCTFGSCGFATKPSVMVAHLTETRGHVLLRGHHRRQKHASKGRMKGKWRRVMNMMVQITQGQHWRLLVTSNTEKHIFKRQ